jgi:hypothetical protein
LSLIFSKRFPRFRRNWTKPANNRASLDLRAGH